MHALFIVVGDRCVHFSCAFQCGIVLTMVVRSVGSARIHTKQSFQQEYIMLRRQASTFAKPSAEFASLPKRSKVFRVMREVVKSICHRPSDNRRSFFSLYTVVYIINKMPMAEGTCIHTVFPFVSMQATDPDASTRRRPCTVVTQRGARQACIMVAK